MDFLKKARRKAEAAMKEVQDNLDKRSQQQQPPTTQQQPQQQYQPQSQSYAPQGSSRFQSSPQYQQQPSGQPQSFYPPPPSQAPQQAHAFPTAQQTYNTAPQSQTYAREPQQQFQQQYVPPSEVQYSYNPSIQQAPPQKCLAKDACLTKYTQFYSLKPTEDFAACSNCFLSFVAPYPNLAAHFTQFKSPDKDHKFVCDFSYPRVQYLFKNQCVPYNTVQPLIDFTRLLIDGSLTSCDGSQVPGPGQMYMTKSEAVPGFACCATCFELNLRFTPFEGNFEIKSYPAEQSWGCDLVLASYKGMLGAELGKPVPDFRNFAAKAKERLNTPECPGPGNFVVAGEGQRCAVYSATGGKSGNICTACYYDYLANTTLADSFAIAYLSDEQVGQIHCDLATEQSKMAIGIAVKRGSDDVWRDSIILAEVAGACVGLRGVDEAELAGIVREDGSAADWYQATEYPGVEICPRCYHLKIKLLDAGHFFSPITRPLVERVIRMCHLSNSTVPWDFSTADPGGFENTLTWRGRKLLNAIDLGYEAGDWSEFLSVCKEISLLPPPCGGRARGFFKGSGRRFLGHIYADPNDPDDLTMVICEECHSRFILNTALAPVFSQDLTKETWDTNLVGGFECLIYSPRLKTNLHEAAKKSDLVMFARYWNIRTAIGKRRQAWEPILEEQKRKQDAHNKVLGLNAMMAVNAQANALMMHGGASFAEAAMTDTGARYGNSTIGMGHLSANGAAAEMAMHNASSMPDISSSGNVVSDSNVFLARYAEDEKAWLEVE